MRIRNESGRISGNAAAAYAAAAEKGGKAPVDPAGGNMAEAIRSVPPEDGSPPGGTGWQRPSNWPDCSKISPKSPAAIIVLNTKELILCLRNAMSLVRT